MSTQASSRAMLVLAAIAACAPRPAAPVSNDLTTTAERTHYARTGRYDEAVALCRTYARVYHDVSCITLGTTVEGRPLVALRVHRASDRNAPVVFVEAGIHAGEIEGKDAGFQFIRDLLAERVAPGALEVVDLVFVPCV